MGLTSSARHGRRRCAGFSGTLFLSALLLLTIAALPAAAENRVALVVGNAHYQFVPSLANPAGDARLMAKTLKDLVSR